MRIFEQHNYRAIFQKLFDREKSLRPRWSLAKLAESVRIQPSYLTNVTKERAHFSADQIFAIGEALHLSESEVEYLYILMELERSTHPQRKKNLKQQLEGLREENLRIEKTIAAQAIPLNESDQAQYYLDPNIELLHLYLGTEHAPAEIADIARKWNLPESIVSENVSFLMKSGLVKKRGKKWVAENISQHLPRESPLCRPQQLLRRLRAMERLQKTGVEKAYAFGAAVTMSEEASIEIRSRFLDFVKEAERIVRDSRATGIYQIQFDLFPWLD